MYCTKCRGVSVCILRYSIPSTLEGLIGILLIHRAALPLHKQMASLWKRWDVASAGGIPRRWPCNRPMSRMVSSAQSLQPPMDSATKGMKVTPTDRQASAWAANFLSSPTARACPWVVEAPTIVSCCRLEITHSPFHLPAFH